MSRIESGALRRALQVNRIGVWEVDSDARTTFVNESMAAILGYRRDEIVGQPVFAFMDASARVATEWSIERRRAGVNEVRELRLLHRDGHPLHVVVAAAPLYDQSGAYEGVSAVLIDASQRHAADAAAGEVAAAISDRSVASDDGPSGTWTLDINTGGLRWSSEVFAIWGVDPANFAPSYEAATALVHPFDRPRIEQTISATVADGKAFCVYFRVVRPDDSVRIAHARGELNGQCTSPTLEGTIQDVTDRLDGEHAITPREREVLDLMAEGLTGTEIASRLQISPETVRSHVQNAIGKLDAHNRVHAVVLALRAREIDL